MADLIFNNFQHIGPGININDSKRCVKRKLNAGIVFHYMEPAFGFFQTNREYRNGSELPVKITILLFNDIFHFN